jgi:PAS domain S-box-containing protein
MQTKKITSILIIDNNKVDFLKIQQMIHAIPENHFQIDWCDDVALGIKKICEQHYDIYFIDFFEDGNLLVESFEKVGLCNPDAPKIVLTNDGNQAFSLQILKMGATDYFIKTELTVQKLECCIRYALDRYEIVKKLRNNEQKYRAVFEQTQDAIFLMDEHFILFDANIAMIELFGYSLQELKGKDFSALMKTNKQFVGYKNILHKKKLLLKSKGDFKKSNLEEFNGELSIVPIHQPGDGNYFQGIIHDITNLKKTERNLLMLEKMAAADRLARTLAHEIRNPLTNINLSLDHLRHNNAQQSQLHYLDIIFRNSKRINDILTELLASSSPSSLTLTPNNLQDILDDSLAVALDRIMLKKIKLQVRYYENPIIIPSNYEQLKIAFLNIIINGVEAMENNTGKLSISIEDNHTTWLVKISDNGIGIPQNQISRLFEPYFTAKRNGMGLGLSASLNILKSHHAEVDVKSEENKGTTFFVSFLKSEYKS